MFNLQRILALFQSRSLTPYDAALRDLAHGKAEAALAALDTMLASQTGARERAKLQNKRGVALVALGRREEARGAFSAALAEHAAFAPALVNLGNLELESQAADTAIEIYRRAIAIDPDNAAAYYHLGVAYKTTGRKAEALEAFARSRRLEGRYRRATSRDRWT